MGVPGLHNKPMAEVHLGHDSEEEEDEEEEEEEEEEDSISAGKNLLLCLIYNHCIKR